MLKLTKTGIGLLTRQYRSVLKKCWAINVGLFILGTASITTVLSNEALGSIQNNTGIVQGTNGTVYLRNGYGNIASGLYLDSAIHYLPLSAFGFNQTDDNYHFLYPTSGGNADTQHNITAFLLGGVINLDTAVYNVAASLNNYYQKTDKISIGSENISWGGLFYLYDSNNNVTIDMSGKLGILLKQEDGKKRTSISRYGTITLYNASETEKTVLSDAGFKLNGSSISATGIVASATKDSTALITSGGVYSALNNYYTKE